MYDRFCLTILTIILLESMIQSTNHVPLDVNVEQRTDLLAACRRIIDNHNRKLFDSSDRIKLDCCIVQTERECFQTFCNDSHQLSTTTTVGSMLTNGTLNHVQIEPDRQQFCIVLDQHVKHYHDNLYACQQLSSIDLDCTKWIANRIANTAQTNRIFTSTVSNSGDHSTPGTMPIWLILVLVLLILVAIGMVWFVVCLFKEDQDSKKKKSKHSRRSSKHSR